MRLLVSVKSADEVGPALAGGADIIDAKEPANGSLGAVSPATLAEVASQVPMGRELSIALGDVSSTPQVIALMEGLRLPSRTATTYLKLGFAGSKSPERVHELLGAAVDAAGRHRFPVTIIAVAYADAERAAVLPAEVILRTAEEVAAGGVLMDTHFKDGTRLLDWRTPERLTAWVSEARESGLMVGLAGALRADDVAILAKSDPDVIGFRGAACDAGRQGRVSVERVALLRRCVDAASNPPSAVLPISPTLGETRDSEANLKLLNRANLV
jgi:(5-formylfuran-3-yl)methyl phosphate synthase